MAIPGPASLIRAASQGYEALDRAASLVPRMLAVVTDVEAILGKVHTLIADIDDTNRRARAVVAESEEVALATAATVARATALVDTLEPIVASYVPTLERLEPVLARLSETTSPDEVAAVVQLIDALPELVAKLDGDILPILDTLATVAPDLHDLLHVSKELNEMLGSLPGLGRIKKRIEENQVVEDDLRAEDSPADVPVPSDRD